jgi:monovalent cation:H+ antiporter-2, CPA2 family
VGGAPVFVQDLAIVIGVAAITAIICSRLRQPFVLGYIVAGLIVGPYLPIPFFADPDRVEAMSDFGVVFVMFSVGLGFSVRKLVQTIPRVGLTLVIELSAMGWFGWILGRALGWSHMESIFSSAVLMVCSSTMIVAKVFDDQKVRGDVLHVVFGLLLLQDMVAVLLMTGLTAIASGSELDGAALTTLLLALGGFLAAFVGGGLLVVPRLFRWLVKGRNTEVILLSGVALCLTFAALAAEFKYSVALGAFLAGSLIAESGEGSVVARLVRPLRDTFAAVFFVSVGMAVDPKLLLHSWPIALLFAAVAITGQFASVSLGAFFSGVGVPTAFRTGLSLGQIGEFCFIIAAIGKSSGLANAELYPSVVGASVITTFTTPLVVRHSKGISARLGSWLPERLMTSASLYTSWMQAVRARRQGSVPPKVPRFLIPVLALETVVLAALFVALGVWGAEVVDWMTAFGKTQRIVGKIIVAALAVTLALVPLLGIVRRTRQIAIRISTLAIPGSDDEEAAQHQGPRRALQVTIQAAAAVGVAALLVLVVQPFIPLPVGPIVVVVALVVFALSLWRGAGKLEEQIKRRHREGVELATARDRDAEGPPSSTGRPSLLTGFGKLTTVRVPVDAPCVGRTLGELDLRKRTECQVIAIERGETGIAVPQGVQAIDAGDILTLAGTPEAVKAARGLLLIRPSDSEK